MSLEISLPFGKKDNVKDIVFSILTSEYPLKIIELTNYIRKRYGKSITFQGVRKAVLELVEDGVLIREDNSFMINKDWAKEARDKLSSIYEKLNQKQSSDVKSIEGDVTVFTFDSLNDLMKYWEDIIEGWYKKFRHGDYAFNCFQGSHGWEALLHPGREKQIMSQLKNKRIKSYAIYTGNTPLDRYIVKFYKSIVGPNCALMPSSKHFDRGFYIATYGDLIVQIQYPDRLILELENFFKKNTSLDNMDMKSLSDIVNKKLKVKLTVIKNLDMAKHINQSIISQIE
jgi:hypothetical protein